MALVRGGDLSSSTLEEVFKWRFTEERVLLLASSENDMMAPLTGAKVIAQALHDLGVTVLHTLVGVPVADIAEEAIDLGIRVIGYRNEQACSYAASVYGYLTGRPGVLLLTGGPGVIHGMAGVSESYI